MIRHSLLAKFSHCISLNMNSSWHHIIDLAGSNINALVLLYLNIPQYSFFAPFRQICKQLGKHNSCSVELCLPEQTSTARTNNNVVLRSHGPLLSFVVHAIKTDPSTCSSSPKLFLNILPFLFFVGFAHSLARWSSGAAVNSQPSAADEEVSVEERRPWHLERTDEAAMAVSTLARPQMVACSWRSGQLTEQSPHSNHWMS